MPIYCESNLRSPMRLILDRLIREDDGASAIEYGLIAGLVAVVLIGALTAMGGSLSSLFDTIAGSLPGGE